MADQGRRRRPDRERARESLRPPRYRLLTAAAALPRRPAVAPSESFERDCPACGRVVLVTQTEGAGGVEYSFAEHGCPVV